MYFPKKLIIDNRTVFYINNSLETILTGDIFFIRVDIALSDSTDRNKDSFFLVNEWVNKEKVDIILEPDGEGLKKVFKDCKLITPIVINENIEGKIELIFKSKSLKFI
jgi:hypothetical protein